MWTPLLLDPIGPYLAQSSLLFWLPRFESKVTHAITTGPNSPVFSPWMLEGFGSGYSSTAPSARRIKLENNESNE